MLHKSNHAERIASTDAILFISAYRTEHQTKKTRVGVNNNDYPSFRTTNLKKPWGYKWSHVAIAHLPACWNITRWNVVTEIVIIEIDPIRSRSAFFLPIKELIAINSETTTNTGKKNVPACRKPTQCRTKPTLIRTQQLHFSFVGRLHLTCLPCSSRRKSRCPPAGRAWGGSRTSSPSPSRGNAPRSARIPSAVQVALNTFMCKIESSKSGVCGSGMDLNIFGRHFY